ncbi:type I restriction enzyme HsdR N-terminal domain-containing protein [Flavobacterium granuli]|uniref:Type I restriction and modification enzyme subunit R-like protein n=1 Tax=Flavobacterium granuli TaxID=280093 RepID=A0A1M5RRG6_9FLAO|nr:type I restriction enzyme HsdR N-terminal domain-containing protein [Flavobacterium granuli]PRZ22776.1 type I restriction and modification enzyme subunit R-like protein [Flavobacterium granuli]SHH28865.1 Type I restriction enzyme R protein N terminus (HSDR_N) [Flavobacterium granuli]
MNEEDIRGKLLLPYIKDLGFDVSEISLEHAFSIRLGKKKHVTGRSDILCKRHNKNLFVIELKNDSIPITQDDIDQGISYARLLLDDIAPFTIVTNGKITRIFDSVSREELSGKISGQSSFWKNGYVLSTEEEIRIRYEALKNFISLSPENLKVFCESQVRDRMGQIIGSIDSPFSKFVKELYVQRKELQIVFEDFINSDESIFGLVGAAGVGKTNAICSLALQKLENTFVFFYNAAILNSPLECISQDLNIAFSSRTETDIVLKKLDELGRYANKNVLIFIDAIDECTNQNITHELSEMALVAKNSDRVKIIISCKSNIWNTILKIKNKPTHLYDELSKSHNRISSLENNPGFLLTDFTDEELNSVLPLYQNEFGFKGVISSSLLKELRNGFFLKIFSEVYCGKLIPEKINDKELIKKYLKQSLEETTIGLLSSLRTLSAIGNIILNHEYTSLEAYKDEGLDVNHILEKLNFSLDENIPEDLFTRNILIKSNNEDSYNISFYYSKIRDYIICFHSYRLDKLTNDEFYTVLCDFYQNHIGKSALDFYIENASSSHLNVLIKFKKDKALSYVLGYNLYLEDNFNKFKNKFDPQTNGNIGIVMPKDLINNDGYGLFPLDSKSNDITAYEDLSFDAPYETNTILQMGVETIYGSNTSLFVKDQSTVIKNNIFKQLKKTIEKGRISVYNSDTLLLEQVSVILYYYYKKLDYEFSIEEYYLPRFKSIYPIDLKDLNLRINKFKLTEFYRYEPMEQNLINEIVENALKENRKIPEYNTTGDVPPFEELSKIVDILLERGYDQIKEHYLPLPDASIIETKKFYEQNRKNYINQIRMVQYSESQAKLYITEFFKHLEICYKEFVEYCFPTFKDEFPFYTAIPHEYIFYMKESDVLKWGTFGYRPSQTGKFEIYFKDTSKSGEAFGKESLKCLRTFSLDAILCVNDYARYPVQTVDKINTSKVDEYCVIRNWIYKFLEDDMKKLFKENDD